MKDEHKLTMSFSDEKNERLLKLVRRAGLKYRADLVNASLKLYEEIINHIEKGSLFPYSEQEFMQLIADSFEPVYNRVQTKIKESRCESTSF